MSALGPALLPGRRTAILPVLVAATSFLLVLAGAASIALGRTAQAIAAAAAGRLTIEIVDADPPARTHAAARALAIARSLREVRAARPVGEAQIARLIAPYLGAEGLANLPLPALIDVELAPGAAPAPLAVALKPIATAHLRGAGEALRPLVRLIGAMRGLALTIMALAAIATGLVTILVARTALEAHGEAVATLHDLGATDRQLAALLQRRILRDAAIGGSIGLAGAAGAILLIGARAAALESGIVEGGGISTGGWIVLASLPIALAGLATLATRIAILRRLAEAP